MWVVYNSTSNDYEGLFHTKEMAHSFVQELVKSFGISEKNIDSYIECYFHVDFVETK